MNIELKDLILQMNPWIQSASNNAQVGFFKKVDSISYIEREFDGLLINCEFDDMCLVLTGPRRAGKTTLGLHISEKLVLHQKRFDQLVYLNCDHNKIREWLNDTLFINEIFTEFKFKNPVILIDEVQRLKSPGLFLKSIVDLSLPVKLIATGSSQLELRSKVQEAMTGRALSEVVLPLSIREGNINWEQRIIFGSYPRVVQSNFKQKLLEQLFLDYINKDIIEILKLRNSDVLHKLLTLVSHGSGQLVNYHQLALDCGVSQVTIKEYLSILEGTFVVGKVTPFVGNKRTEITKSPVFYFFDNGFRNQALGNFLPLDKRTDAGLLIESFVYQELYKFVKNNKHLKINYWRTKAGAEVDFVITKSLDVVIPIEVKYRNLSKPSISRGFRSFIDAYNPKCAFVITKSLIANLDIDGCEVKFIPLERLGDCLGKIDS